MEQAVPADTRHHNGRRVAIDAGDDTTAGKLMKLGTPSTLHVIEQD